MTHHSCQVGREYIPSTIRKIAFLRKTFLECLEQSITWFWNLPHCNGSQPSRTKSVWQTMVMMWAHLLWNQQKLMKEAVYQVYAENYGSSRGQWLTRTSPPLLLVQLVWKKYFRYVHMVAESDRILYCILNNCIIVHDCRQLHFLKWPFKWCISLASLNKAMQSQLFTLLIDPLQECIGYFFSIT